MNRRRRRFIITLVTMLPVLAFLIMTGIYLALQVRDVLGRVDVLLVEELRRQTGRAVEVGRVEVSPLGSVVIHDIRIANGETFAAGVLLEAERIIVNYRWLDLVRRRIAPIESIESVRLISPKILLERFRTGRLNIQDLITPKPRPPGPPFRGVVRVENGDLVFRDWRARLTGTKPAVTRFVALDGTFDATNAPFYVYDLMARSPRGRLFDRVSLSGSIDNRKGRLALDVRADKAAIGHWSRYFVSPGAVTIRQGSGDIRFSATRSMSDGRRIWRYAGAATVRDGSASIVGFRQPATNVRGRVDLTGQTVTLNLSAALARTPFTITGSVADLTNPKLNLQVTSRNANFAEILRAARIPEALRPVAVSGRGLLRLQILGPTENLVFGIRTTIPQASGFGYRAANLDIRATYTNDVIEIERASARALNGRLVVEGAISLRERGARLALSGSASSVQLALISELRDAGLQGIATGTFSVTGTAERPRIEARVQVSAGMFNEVGFGDAIAHVAVTEDGTLIRSLSAAAGGGVVRLSGAVTADRLDLSTVAIGVDLESLLRPLNITGYTGTANFRGRITGPPSDPIVVGTAEVFEGRFRQVEFDYARGRLVASRREVALEDAVVRVLPAEATFRGRVIGIGTRAPRVELDVSVAQAPADRILSLLSVQADVTGAVTGRLTVRGTAPDVTAAGTLTLTDGSVAGYPVTSARADVVYSAGRLRLTDLTARSDGAVLSAEGAIDRQGNLAFKFVGNDIALAQFAELTRPYVILAGTANLSGTITGTTRRPNIVATIVSNQPTINTAQFERFEADLTWNGTTLIADDILLRTDDGEFFIDGVAYNTDENMLTVEGGRIREFSVPSLYTLLAESPYVDEPEAEGVRNLLSRVRRPQSGVVTASFSATGPIDRLEARANISAGDIDVGEVENARVEMAVLSRRGFVELESFELVADAINVSARGTLVADGRTDLEVDAYNVDLVALTPATGPLHIGGVATVRASVEGPIRSPLITASAELVEPVIYGLNFDRLRASQITIGQNSIDISRVLVTKNEHSGTFYGVIPWNWSTFSVPADQPIALHASMDEQTLGIIAVLSDAIIADRTSGRLSANLDVTGTLSQPNLGGRMTIADGTVGLGDFETDFTDVQADFAFSGDTVRVERLIGKSSAGGTFEVASGGTVSLTNVISPLPGQPRGMLDLAFRASDLKVIERDFFGYREWVTATLSTGENGVTVTGSLTQPLVAGRVVIGDASVIVSPSATLGRAPGAALLVNPRFDLTFALRDDVWLRTQNLRAMLEGEGALTGTLNDPSLRATLTVARGDLRLPTQRMRITRGTVNVDWTREEARTVVDIRAQTSLAATGPTGERRRYTIIMTVQGPLEQLQPENINLESDPPGLSRERILAALGHFEDIFGGGEIALSQQLSDIFTLAAPLVFAPLETAFIEALGLEEFNIEYGFEQPLAVFASRRLFDNFYFSYWRIVTGAPSITGATYLLRLSYRARDWLDFSYVRDSRRIDILEAAYRRRF